MLERIAKKHVTPDHQSSIRELSFGNSSLTLQSGTYQALSKELSPPKKELPSGRDTSQR